MTSYCKWPIPLRNMFHVKHFVGKFVLIIIIQELKSMRNHRWPKFGA